MEKKAIIFDLDGTLWNGTDKSLHIYNEVFSHSDKVPRSVTQQEVNDTMGMFMPDVVATLFPELPLEDRMALAQECCEAEVAYFYEHGAVLYPHVEETLHLLAEKYDLYVASNCQEGYIEAFIHAHKLDGVFADFEMPGRTGKYKGENVRLLLERNGVQQAIMVGDTYMDQEAAAFVGIPFVHAKYGFGQVTGEDAVMEDFAQLPEIAERLWEEGECYGKNDRT